MTTIDMRRWNSVNVWTLSSGELCVRPGFRRIYTPDSGKTLVGGFSVDNEYTGEVMHYVFDVASSGRKALRLQLLTEDFTVWQTFSINADTNPRAITFAVIEGQIIIASPDFPTLWGLVGGDIQFATKVSSDNPATTAIEVPRGICTSWNNRVVIANGRSLYVSDPIAATGGSPRTFVAENQNQRPGVVYGIHEGAGGQLVCVTSQGTYGLDSGYAATQIVGGNGTGWSLLSHHRAVSYQSSCVVKGRVYALSTGGWVPVDTESIDEISLSQPVMCRSIGTRISLEDYRDASMFAMDSGPVVASGDLNAAHFTDLSGEISSWWTSAHSPTSFFMRGTLREPGGGELLICENGVFRVEGNFDGEIALTSGVATQPKGVLLGVVAGGAKDNRNLRHISIAAEVGGAGSVRAAYRGVAKAGTPPADPEGITIGTDAWGTSSKVYTATPMAGVRFDFSRRATRDVAIEAGADGCMARVLPVADAEYSESAPARDQTVGA
jgi:hypothetical protein